MRFSTKLQAIFLIMVLCLVCTSPVFAAEKVNALIQNRTGGSVALTLRGPETRTLTLPEKSTTVSLTIGNYKYSYEACGKTYTGTFKLKTKGDLLTLQCKGNAGSEGKSTLIKLEIVNRTDSALRLRMSGPGTYSFYLPLGSTNVELLSGKYSFTISGVCGTPFTDSGTQKISRNRIWTFYCN